MERNAPVSVSHHQFQILSDEGTGEYLDLHTVGDDLLQVTGRGQLTVLTGPHTGKVRVEASVRSTPPPANLDGWHAAAEANLWCPTGRLAICELMDSPPAALAGLAVERPGLLRVRVMARDREWDDYVHGPEVAERHRVVIWPVEEETGFRTLRTDGVSISWQPDPARAAGWAMLQLAPGANPSPEELILRMLSVAGRRQPAEPIDRIAVCRQQRMPVAWVRDILDRPAPHLGAIVAGDDLVLPADDLEIVLSPVAAAGFAARWRWRQRSGSTTAVPDRAGSLVELSGRPGPGGDTTDLHLVHRGVEAGQAVLLGLIWDYLLDRCQAVAGGSAAPPHPWLSTLATRAQAATGPAQKATPHHVASEARLRAAGWVGRGGGPPTAAAGGSG